MEQTRIQKIIAESGYCSRRRAEELILQGKVKVNGHPAQLGQKADPAKDRITVDGELLPRGEQAEKRYIALYKPRGYLTAMSDDRGRKCVSDLVRDIPERVYPVGRLDLNSEGLLLFTNDGEFANQMMHPSCGVTKTYRVTVHSSITDSQLVSLTEGVVLDDGDKTSPAIVRIMVDSPERSVMLITLSEGKNREIRRMCDAVGLTVARLKRISVGSVKLGMLRPGEYRDLTAEELSQLRSMARLPGARKKQG